MGEMKAWVVNAMDCVGVAVTVLDSKGVLHYYNTHAAEVLGRKPEYIGTKVYEYHKKPTCNEKIKSMINDFQNGRTAPFRYKATSYEKHIFVTVSPIFEEGIFRGCVQSVVLEDEVKSE